MARVSAGVPGSGTCRTVLLVASGVVPPLAGEGADEGTEGWLGEGAAEATISGGEAAGAGTEGAGGVVGGSTMGPTLSSCSPVLSQESPCSLVVALGSMLSSAVASAMGEDGGSGELVWVGGAPWGSCKMRSGS